MIRKLTAFILIIAMITLTACNSPESGFTPPPDGKEDKEDKNDKDDKDDKEDKKGNAAEVTFVPFADNADITDAEIDAAVSVMEQRVNANKDFRRCKITPDYANKRIDVTFKWRSSEKDFNPEQAVKELGEVGRLAFYEGSEQDETKLVLTGEDVSSARAQYTEEHSYVVALEFKGDRIQAFSEVTGRLQGTGGVVSIWLDDTLISAPRVTSQITEGKAEITGGFTPESAKDLANKINSGALPFKLEAIEFNVKN